MFPPNRCYRVATRHTRQLSLIRWQTPTRAYPHIPRPSSRRAIRTKSTSNFDELSLPTEGITPLAPLSTVEGIPKGIRKTKALEIVEEIDLPQGLILPEPVASEGDLLPSAEGQILPDPMILDEVAPKRTRKTRAKVSVENLELPQGLIPLNALPPEDDAPAYPTVILQAWRNMQKFENCVLLTRVGGFYEMYFEHADEYGRLLNLKVAKKTMKAGGPPPVSMAGFPFFNLDRYLKILVQDHNRYVAIAEEIPNDPSGKVKSGGLMHDRKVTRIVTPGTLIDENFMDPFTNNYVLAINAKEHSDPTSPSSPIGLAWLDLSTGHFFTQTTTLSALPSFLARTGPKEVVLEESLQESNEHGIFSVLKEDHYLISYVNTDEVRPIQEWAGYLESPIPKGQMHEFTDEEVMAGSALLEYVETRLQGSGIKLQPPSRQYDMMGIDKNTMRALEIRKTIRDDNFAGSLLHTIRRTNTKSGARLLDSWLSSPSTSLETINTRLDMVTHLLNDEFLRERVMILLKRSHDSHRLLQKFGFGKGDADDLLYLATTIAVSQDLVTTLTSDENEEKCVRLLVDRVHLDGPTALERRIREAIDEDGIVQQHQMEEEEAEEVKALTQSIVNTVNFTSSEDVTKTPRKKPGGIRDYYSDENEAWTMRPTASPSLERLHKELLSLHIEKQTLATSLCARLAVTSLTLRFTPGLGHICHIKGSKDLKRDLTITDSDLKAVGSNKSTRSFHHPEWTDLGQRLDQCRIHIRAEEQRVFNNLREEVILNIINLRRNAAVLDELDVACSFATLAAEKQWTRPILNQSTAHKIAGGRHPTVEGGLEEEGRSFVTNDCFVGDVQRSWLITGPNMAGKSTFLRQNALITILAQVGSYVPAQYAEIGIVDQIFSRVGSADNLYRDQSTFMVEMLETAAILRTATPRSFVIMDEIGRGTTPTDGTAVAFACLHHLYHVNKSRTLFATHFHALADMVIDERMEGVGFYCTDVEEEDGGGDGFRYVHKLKQGVNRESHALKVARLAGLPEDAIGVAERVLEAGAD